MALFLLRPREMPNHANIGVATAPNANTPRNALDRWRRQRGLAYVRSWRQLTPQAVLSDAIFAVLHNHPYDVVA